MKEVLHALVVKASWRDLTAVVFVSDKFISFCVIFLVYCFNIAREISRIGLFGYNKVPIFLSN